MLHLRCNSTPCHSVCNARLACFGLKKAKISCNFLPTIRVWRRLKKVENHQSNEQQGLS